MSTTTKKPHRTFRRKLTIALFLVVGVPLLLYTVLFIRFNTRTPNIATDHIAELNATLPPLPPGVSPIDTYTIARDQWINAVTIAEQAIRDRGDWPLDEAGNPVRYSIFHEIPAFTPDKPNYQDAHDTLVAFGPTIDEILGATEHPHSGFRLEDPAPQSAVPVEHSLYQTLLPNLSVVRHTARIIAADAHLAALEGDADRALGSLIAVHQLADQTEHDPFVLSALVAIAIQQLADGATLETLRDHPNLFSDTHLNTLAQATRPIDPEFHRRALDSGKRMIEDMLQRLYTDNGQGSGKLTPYGLTLAAIPDAFYTVGKAPDKAHVVARILGPIASPFFLSRGDINEIVEQLHAAAFAALDDPARINEIDPLSVMDDPISKINSLGLFNLLPPYVPYIEAVHVQQVRIGATRIAIALHRYHLAHHEFPETLDALVPEFLDAIPEDIFDPGQPIKYARTDTAFTLYSVGTDGQDNNATPINGRSQQQVRNVTGRFRGSIQADGLDWILYPSQTN